MKTKIVSLSLLLYVCTCFAPQKMAAQASVSFQVFYDDLSPYGTWINNPQYGYVWMPNVSAGFTPYSTNGYWTFTDEGWTWVSNYPWGWAPFHYGRWYNDITYGPVWVPDNEWGPGWVSWRSSGSYYGWAPMGPGVTYGMAYGSGYYDTYNQYTFVRCGYMGRSNIYNYYENHTNSVAIINNTTIINNNRVDKVQGVTYSAGPQKTEVEKRVGKPIVQVAIKESSKPEQRLSNNQLQLYRPQVQKNDGAGTKPVPAKVSDLKEVKTISQRKAEAPVQKPNQQGAQPQQGNSPRKIDGAKQPQPITPSKNMDGDKQPPKKSPEPQHTQPLRNNLPPHQQPNQPQNSLPQKKGGENTGEPGKQQPIQPERTIQPNEPKRSQPQRTNEPPRQQPNRPQQSMPVQREEPRNVQPNNQPPAQPQQQPNRPQQTMPEQREQPRNIQPNNQPPAQPQQRNEPPQQQPQRNEPPQQQPQQPMQPQRNQPPQQQPQQHNEPPREQPQRNEQPRQQPQQNNPRPNEGKGNRPH